MNPDKILIIDDEQGIREGCRRALAAEDFRVETAESGQLGLEMVQQNGFGLALIDVMMPGINGIELIAKIHAHDPEIVCVIITGYATVELAVQAIKQGAYDFLTKPFSADDLIRVVHQGLERRNLTLEAQRLQAIEAEAQRLAAEKSRLEELDRAKAAFIRLATHELKAPTGAILTYLDLLLNNYASPEETRDVLLRMQERANEQLALITDLLEFGRLKEMRQPGKPDLVHLDAVLKTILDQNAAQADEKGISISAEIPPGLPCVCLDPEHAKSLWSNLISNAIKYNLPGGSVRVSMRQENGSVICQVQDTGIGIPEEARGQLFGEFFRARNAKALNIPGTGLGLAIVKQILEKAGGEIWMESEPGKGTKFTFWLPVALAPGN